jgi:hypothetical protein
MLLGRSLNVVAPVPFERNVMPPASSVYVEIIRRGIRDVGIVGGTVTVDLVSQDPVLYPGTLSGTKTRPVVNGVAVFDGLSVNVPGEYWLNVSCENDLLQETSTSPTSGSLSLWRVFGLPITADQAHAGRWVNITGPGAPLGIWGKIVDTGTDGTLGEWWDIEQPTGATSISTIATYSGLLTVRYNSAQPLLQPPLFLALGADTWLTWNPNAGANVLHHFAEETNDTLEDQIDLFVQRHVSVQINSAPTSVLTGETHGILAVILNQDGTVASDINDTALLEVRHLGVAVSSQYAPIVNGGIFDTVVMPGATGNYVIWVQYQGDWYDSQVVSDSRDVVVASDTSDPEPPGTPPTVVNFPPKVYTLQAGGCYLQFAEGCYLELGAPDSYIEVIVK